MGHQDVGHQVTKGGDSGEKGSVRFHQLAARERTFPGCAKGTENPSLAWQTPCIEEVELRCWGDQDG